jgi:hypothetical protein
LQRDEPAAAAEHISRPIQANAAGIIRRQQWAGKTRHLNIL